MSRLSIERDVPLAPLTSLELGGPARFFVRVQSEEALAEAFAWAAEQQVQAAVQSTYEFAVQNDPSLTLEDVDAMYGQIRRQVQESDVPSLLEQLKKRRTPIEAYLKSVEFWNTHANWRPAPRPESR